MADSSGSTRRRATGFAALFAGLGLLGIGAGILWAVDALRSTAESTRENPAGAPARDRGLYDKAKTLLSGGRENTPVSGAVGVPADDPFAKIRILGRVYDEATERGIGGALVRIRPTYEEPKLLGADSEGWLGFTTQADGSYALMGIPPGSWDVEASAVGYLPSRGEFRKFSAVEDDEGFDFGLERAGTVEGHVVDSKGRPVAGARLGLLVTHGVLAPSPIVVTNEEGRFVLDPVSAEDLTLHVEHPEFAPKSHEIAASPEAIRRVEIVLGSGKRLRGVVRDAYGPVAGARVAIDFADSPEGRFFYGRGLEDAGEKPDAPRGVLSDANGAFQLEVPVPSRLMLSGEANGYRRTRLRVNIREGKEEPVALILEPGATLTGRVLGGDGRPRSHATVEVAAEESVSRAETGADGRFTVEGLGAAGPWTVYVTHHEHPPFRIEETDLSGEHTYRLEAPGRILGWIRDARTRAPITKYGYQLTGPQTSSGGAVSLSGSFEIGELVAGTYTVRISAEGYLEGRAENVVVSPGQTTDEVHIDLEPGASVSGRVLGPGSFHVFATSNGAVAAATGTDEHGEFRLEPLAAGVYSIGAANEDGVTKLDGVEVSAGADVTGLTLEPPTAP